MKIAGMNSHEINDETNSINISPVRIEIYFYHEERTHDVLVSSDINLFA